MCFSEFIGYTCGHSSAEVLRPCPMTTQLHTNPLCARHARRPILAPEMCPACQRVLHGRAVLITEWEHRWMHERGVCGCEVRFPDLVRPRVVGRENGPGAANGYGAGRGGGGNMEVYVSSLPRMGGTNGVGGKSVPAIYQETLTTTADGGGRKPEVAIRMPSFYGAEWVDEHRQLHLKDSCKCPGDFSFYKTPASYQAVTSSSVHHRREQVVRIADSQPSQIRSSQNGTMSAQNNPQKPPNTRNSRPAYPSYPHLQQATHTQTSHTPQHVLSHQVRNNQSQMQQHSAVPGQTFTKCGDTTGPSIPPRSTGAIYEVDPAKSTNKLYNFACNEGAKITSCADMQSVDFPKPSGVLPLVGLPIGAGPEGPADLPHTGDFNYCVLHANLLIASLGEPCFMRYRSNSVSCLHELKVARVHTDPATHTQSANISAETSPSQSVDSSPQASDDEE
ncbi:hypothetical protein VMCG_00907 [Cytospora schulzeri]|uniref:Uncharacterized protein n=1 Tax=Cytospora schulzeri TaxID=448051 RepID=A0A423X4W2_9PEZI|nr:hypothetical protein VMCG_00907 [Valsa malicola]